jgi:hypothetical protein
MEAEVGEMEVKKCFGLCEIDTKHVNEKTPSALIFIVIYLKSSFVWGR